jgi:hypothetical protein
MNYTPSTAPRGPLNVMRDLGIVGPLKLRLDYKFANPTGVVTANEARGKFLGPLSKEGRRNLDVLFSSHLICKKSITITNRQLYQIAINGFKEMQKGFALYNISRAKKPRVITVLAVNNEIFISSSAKGPSYTYALKNSKVLDDLNKCQKSIFGLTKIDTLHSHLGSCGEIFAAHQFLEVHNSDMMDLKDQKNSRIITVGWMQNWKIGILPPCGVSVPQKCRQPPF